MKFQSRVLLAFALVAVALAAVVASPAAPPDRRFAVTYARLVEGTPGRHLVVRVKGPRTTKSVRVRVTLLRHTRVIRVVVRAIPTNKRVKVPRLSIPAKITTVRVRIVGHVG
jgi:hypothetical protein